MSRMEEIPFEVIRSDRKTMSLSVTREGKAVVRAPRSVSMAQIRRFVSRHETWLKRHMAERSTPAPTFCDGERIPVCGIVCTIATGARARIDKTTLYLPAEGREEALISLLRYITRLRMTEELNAICQRCGLSYTGLSVTAARGRWGSCSSKKRISFTFRTAFLPKPLAEYLAAHELCHTLHMNHSEAFWRDVSRIVPDYAKRRKALKDYLWAMKCL